MSVTSSELSGSTGEKSNTVCFLCRQRKTKCDRRLPSCAHCQKAKISCKYVAQIKKRGLRAGYVSELERRLENVENELSLLRDNDQLVSLPQSSPLSIFPITAETPRTPTSGVVHGSSDFGITPRSIPRSTFSETRPVVPIPSLQDLSRPLLRGLVELWFKECHPWCPILLRKSVDRSLDELPEPVTNLDDIVLKALITVTISQSSQAIVFGYTGRHALYKQLRSEVLLEATTKWNLESVQALLLLALHDYGFDNMSSTWGLLAMARRMCERTGVFKANLLKINGEQQLNHVSPPTLQAFDGDDLALPLAWFTFGLDATSTLGVSWRDPSAALMDHLSSVAYRAVPDFLDSFKTVTHLSAITLQPVHALIHDQEHQIHSNFERLQACDEVYEHLSLFANGLAPVSYTVLADGSIGYNPNAVLTSTIANAAVIILYQRCLELPTPLGDHPQELGVERCLTAYDNMIRTLVNLSDVDIEFSSPLVASYIFVTARLKLVLCRAATTASASSSSSSSRRDAKFDVLMHALNMCGRRWPIARRLDIVLRAAIVEMDMSQSAAVLPTEFWDLKLSHIDIEEKLKEWVQGYEPSLFVGSLNGPYA